MVTQADVDEALAAWENANLIAQGVSQMHAANAKDFWDEEERMLHVYKATFIAFKKQQTVPDMSPNVAILHYGDERGWTDWDVKADLLLDYVNECCDTKHFANWLRIRAEREDAMLTTDTGLAPGEGFTATDDDLPV
jgi:hypothetical protein